ncbi:LacI family DNA-binding transcriptional regulator, partial [Paraburkholderia sp. SIMBA_055]
MSKNSVTVIDIAREAGVSKSTVSLVLRGSPLVHAETRAKVQEAIEELGYVSNHT